MPAYPARQIERSLRAIAKQRAMLEDGQRPVSEIRKPYQMKTRDFKRRIRILAKHERLFAQAMARTMYGV